MKRIISLFTIVLVLLVCMSGCGNSETTTTEQKTSPSTTPTATPSPSTADDTVNIKEVAVPADFIEINAGNWKGKKVVVTGEINAIDKEGKLDVFPNCMISQEEGDGYIVYMLRVPEGLENNTLQDKNDGDIVTVYGVVDKPQENTHWPTIVSIIMEKQ
ncbi:hypothetical protein SDC9_151894 [bioreactor metagenome]|uniref:Lipoprotein n=2 Tax=root TaxID=1 RepID=A0AAC9W2G3_EUBLI|nr:hypothetical protein [Eubacterium limosum]ARD65007.1 hypothetical protein B2M23_05380 [Eubacterium limosum]PWW52966.1 hypothetical protein C7955_106238 [Eubacterium limosum]UQZ20970.1 hypothetical protein M5595_12045 [Eubacterium limosum]